MSSDPDYYEPFLIGMDLTENEKDLFVVNAQRFQEICLDNFSGLKIRFGILKSEVNGQFISTLSLGKVR